jgi:hypothetical protein
MIQQARVLNDLAVVLPHLQDRPRIRRRRLADPEHPSEEELDPSLPILVDSDGKAAAHPRPGEEESTQFLAEEQLRLRNNNCCCRTTKDSVSLVSREGPGSLIGPVDQTR